MHYGHANGRGQRHRQDQPDRAHQDAQYLGREALGLQHIEQWSVIDLDQQEHTERRASGRKGDRIDRRGNVIPADPHRPREQMLTCCALIRELPDRGGLRDRHVVENAETGDDHPADHYRGKPEIGRRCRQQVVVLGGETGQVRPLGRDVAQ